MSNTLTQKRPQVAEWNPLAVRPRALFQSPDMSLLCAKKVEGQFYDRKSKIGPGRLAEIICSFANSDKEHGGLLAIGISDNGEVEGLRDRPDVNVNKLLKYHYYTGTPTERKFVDCLNKDGETNQILLIYVPYMDNRVAETSNGKTFVREGDSTRELRYAERRELEYAKGQISFEDEIACEYDPNLIVREILDEFKKSISGSDGAGTDISEEQVLFSRHLLKKQDGKLYLTNAGLLLLGKDPKACIPGAYVRFIRYEGTEKKAGRSHNVVKDELFSDPLPRLIQRLHDFLPSQLREFTFLGHQGKFIQEPEYPEFAWQEAVVNALVHRSYSLRNSPVLIEMYDDKLELTSPGDYPACVHPREFIHYPRNPHLMDVMRYLKFVRMLNEGSLRIRNEMERANLPTPEFSRPGNPYVRLILRNDVERRVKERTGEGEQVSEFANLFRITLDTTDSKKPVSEHDSPPDFSEIRQAVTEALRAQGYAIDSFTNDVAVDFRDEYIIPELAQSQLASIYPGFRFRIHRFQDGFYLTLDHTIQVRNRATLQRILSINPAMKSRSHRKGFVRKGEKWYPCFIHSIDDDRVSLQILSKENKTEVVLTKDVMPSLPTTSIAELLQKVGVRVDLFREVKKLALSLSKNAARERSARTIDIAKRLSEKVFPLQVRGYKLFLTPSPRRLKGPGMLLKSDLVDVQPVFSKETQAKASTVINGLTTYGSYDKPEHEIPLVLLCTSDKLEPMRALVKLLRQGSVKFRGIEKTFAISFSDPIEAVANTPAEYLAKCRQICATVPQEAFFLVYCPEKGYSRSDYHAPYYEVKHFLLEAGFPSQMVDEETVRNPSWKDYNLALDIFAKAGHVPWVLSKGLPDADLFLGLSYSSIQKSGDMRRLIGYVNVFDHYGKWLYYKGNTKPIGFGERNKVFGQLLREVAEEYQSKAKLQRVHVHHGFKLSREARQEIASGVNDVAPEAEVSFVYVNKYTPMRLYDDRAEGDGTLRRGAYLVVAPNNFVISTTGQNEFGQKPMGTPRPLEISINRIYSKGDLDTRIYAQHILSLTKLNWASTKDFCREPITLKFASNIAYLMNVFLASFGEFHLHERLEKTPWFL